MALLTILKSLPMLFVIRSCQAGKLPKFRAVAYPEVFDGRKENTRVLKINEEITLNLEPGSVLHEEFFVREYSNGVPEETFYDVRELQKNLYHDEKRLAAVMIFEEGGTLKVEGVIGPNLKIRPIETAERSEHGRQAHLVENIEDSDSAEVYGQVLNDKITISQRAARDNTQFDSTKFNVDTIYPEVLFVCDSRFREGFERKNHLVYYMMVSFQVVNVRYRALSNPKVKLVMRGIELSNWTQEREYYVHTVGDEIDAYNSLLNIVKFVTKNNKTYGRDDMVYFTTGYDLAAIYINGKVTGLQGYAFAASACTDNREQLGEDKAHTYMGIRIMTHEIAHTLGCTHDGTKAPGIAKAFIPDAERCPWGDGYIMSYQEEDHRSMKFSDCCRYDIRQMSWTVEGDCLHRNNSQKIPRNWLKRYQLPGDYLSLNRQCEIAYPYLWRTYFLEKMGKASCKGYCFVPGDQYEAADHHWHVLLLDGTVCWEDPKYICINGDCVPDGRKGHFEKPPWSRKPKSKVTTAANVTV